MGWGDQLMATGLARGAALRGKRIAFGDGHRIIWDFNSEPVFSGNPNVAHPGSERSGNIEWVPYYKGRRIYNSDDRLRQRWIWNYDFKAVPGEVFFSTEEKHSGRRAGDGFVLIEPNVEGWKSVAPNKDWGRQKYQAVADALGNQGHRVVQFLYDKSFVPLSGVQLVKTESFRDALAVMRHASLYVGPEGGLHHAAAAVGIKGVVLFGGFIPPAVTGYDSHANLAIGEACGNYKPCDHCRQAMASIGVDQVLTAAQTQLECVAA